VKPASQRKNRTKPARQRPKTAEGAVNPVSPETTPRARRPYPSDVMSPESNAEFLRCMADVLNERADEVERGAARQHQRAPKSPK
jgi:hypothetical protein